jgi:hypothetical protein
LTRSSYAKGCEDDRASSEDPNEDHNGVRGDTDNPTGFKSLTEADIQDIAIGAVDPEEIEDGINKLLEDAVKKWSSSDMEGAGMAREEIQRCLSN